jgi:hypothetical protein
MKETQTKTYNMIMKEKGKKNIGKGCTGMDILLLSHLQVRQNDWTFSFFST